MSQRLATIKELELLLYVTTQEREARTGVVAGEPEWVVHERQVMHAAVNERRAERGLPAVSLDDVVHAERLAAGHHDYVAKFALHCADLVEEDRRELAERFANQDQTREAAVDEIADQL